MFKELLTPAKTLSVIKNFSGDKDRLGSKLVHAVWDESSLPDAVILGITDDRISSSSGFANAPSAIREQLYQLKDFSGTFLVVDLGDVKTGKDVADTIAAVRLLSEELVSRNIPLLFIGGNQSFTIPLITGINKSGAILTIIDDRIDSLAEEEWITDDIFLNNLSAETIVNVMAVQSFFVSPDSRDTFAEEFNGSLITLGDLRNDIEEMEPFLRETDLVSFDFGALKLCEAPGQIRNSPNGLTGEEACQLSWYAGISTKPCWFSLFGYNPDLDPAHSGAMMAAQICWYFLQAKSKKSDEVPQDEAIDFLHFIVPIEGIPEPVTFLKHPVSKRWWMEVPSPDCDLFPLRVPCSKKDYRRACKNEIPDRWWISFNKSY
ncbi:MAG TPA: arginase family protein [Prolixibacteraceae bacterium]